MPGSAATKAATTPPSPDTLIAPSLESLPISHPIAIDKYLVSPLAKRLPDSRFAASVSIRSGRGSGTHDRVLRLIPLFDNRPDALRYAMREGLAWLNERHGVPMPSIDAAAHAAATGGGA